MAIKGLSSLHLMGIISILYMLLMWMAYRQLERQMQYNEKTGIVFRPQIQQDGRIRLYAKECPVHHNQRHGHLSSYVERNVVVIKPGTCPVSPAVQDPQIQMEKEWNRINVGYPQYVYTVTGWIQVIDVPNYTAKPLHVIIIPHSHQDPGWKDSYAGYYNGYTKKTLNNIVDKLTENPKLKFIWSEVVFLNKWFYEPGANTDKLFRLIRNGQFEIVSGGWVMTDEAVSHYTSMLNQLIDGHLWLKNTFGIIPNTSWSVDPFGHSPTMTYMLKRAGINKMVIQRTHFGIKRHFAKRQNLEFMWRQAWDASGHSDVLCHMMPFLLYSISYSCGPDPHVCCQFDFHSSKCFIGTKEKEKESVTDKNKKKLSWALWEQFQKKSQLYQSNVLLVPHGDDFRYSMLSEWDEQFKNLDKLMNYMNSNKDMDIKIEYGTVSDYFNALEQSRGELAFKEKFPTLSGDFLPYNDRDDQYWTGFYSVRPLLKNMVRVLQGKLRITEILFSVICTQNKKRQTDYSFYEGQTLALEEGRHAVNLFQHHDAITGTSAHVVMEDYQQILKSAMNKVDDLLLLLIGRSVLKTLNPSKHNSIVMADPWAFDRGHIKLRVNRVEGNWLLFVTNPLTIPWKSAVTVRTSTPGVIKTMDNVLVPSQVNPLLDSNFFITSGNYGIVFEADLEPLSVKTYMFIEQKSDIHYAVVTVYGSEIDPSKFKSEFGAKTSSTEMPHLENGYLGAYFSACTGTLQYTMRKTDDELHQTSLRMVTYGTGSWSNPFRDKSGAYIFMPDGHAREMEVLYPTMVQLEGPVMSSIMTKLPGVVTSATLYNISGPVGTGVHIENMVNINWKEWDNKEIAMRIVSDVLSPDNSICVDLNGFQMHNKRWRSKLLIQGNFQPVTSAAFIEDGKTSRLTLLTSESHGVASLSQGWLEAVLDRRMMQDDWRGLNEGPHDNTFSPSKFILIPEKRDLPGRTKGPSCRLSMLAHLLSDHLNNPLQVAFTTEKLVGPPQTLYFPSVNFLDAPFPCAHRLINLRYIENSMRESQGFSLTALMVLHRIGVDCSFNQVYTDCAMDEQLNLDTFKDIKMKQAIETSLTGVQDIQDLRDFNVDIKDMEMKTVRVSFHRYNES